MPSEFKLPELGENIEAGDVVQVLVSVGDTIAIDQPVLELETDKATIEVPSPMSGRVKEIAVKAGDKIKVGQLILTVDVNGEAHEVERAASGTPAPPARAADGPSRDAEEEEETGTEERPASAGPARRAEVVDFARVTQQAPAQPERDRAPALAAPSVRRLAREIGVEISDVGATGPSGRVLAEDVKAHAKRLLTSPAPSSAEPAVLLPDFTRWGEIERLPMRSVRRKTAERLAHAWRSVVHVTQHDKADVTSLEQLRQKVRRRPDGTETRLSMTAFALKIAAAALKAFPQFNASVDIAREEIIFKHYVHIGVAVDTDRGLLVPVVREVDRKGVVQLSSEVADLAEKARSKRLTLEEMEGGTFTITNLGGLGGTYFTPIVKAPEVAILGLSRSAIEPVLVDGRFEPRLMLPLSLSYDHRAIDGADAVRFLRWVVERFEQPYVLELDRQGA